MEKQQNVREKLVELLQHDNCPLFMVFGDKVDVLADYLIANGVTVADGKDTDVTDNNVGHKWIPVTERLPEDVYGKDREQIVVLVCTKSGKVSQCARMADYECIADETLTKVEWVKNGKFYWSKNKAVTHWMPMPEPPKGE